jgi:hypothetical protein
VLGVDTDVAVDRSEIDFITVTVGEHQQDWQLAKPLPGSLGIVTSPGEKDVIVQGFAGRSLRVRWAGRVTASKGVVAVTEIHLVRVNGNVADAGALAIDGGVSEAGGSVEAGSYDGIGTTEAALVPTEIRLGSDAGTPVPSGRDAADEPAVVVGKDAPVLGRDGSTAPDVAQPETADAVLDPPQTALTGSFALDSHFTIPATSAATGTLGDILGISHGLVTDPGAMILDYADQAGVPGLATLRSVLPDAVMGKVGGWMGSYIKSATVAGISPYDSMVTLDNAIQLLILDWNMQSRLDVPVGAPGTHSPVSFTFPSLSSSATLPLEATAVVTKGIGISATLSWPNGANGVATTILSDHAMGVPFGRYALSALDTILSTQLGAADITTYLANQVGCAGLADSVASYCVAFVCVGHKAELTDICTGGLSEIASQIEDRIKALDFKAIHFQKGMATAVGSSVARPQDATALKDGVWTVTLDFGDGPKTAAATFSATAK